MARPLDDRYHYKDKPGDERRTTVTRLIQGVLAFQQRVFGGKKSLFGRLARGQQPPALFITCSDSRINPNLLTQAEPGELFILRNAGNLVPPPDAPPNGEAATIEYAVAHLRVRDVVLCGHTRCGAVQGLLDGKGLDKMPAVASWLAYAREVLDGLPPADALSAEKRAALAVEKNVLVQLEHLKAHPAVRAALDAGALRLHGWVYDFATGKVDAYDPVLGRFGPLTEARLQQWLARGGEQPGGETPDLYF
jgi:carbonic anhydrase